MASIRLRGKACTGSTQQGVFSGPLWYNFAVTCSITSFCKFTCDLWPPVLCMGTHQHRAWGRAGDEAVHHTIQSWLVPKIVAFAPTFVHVGVVTVPHHLLLCFNLQSIAFFCYDHILLPSFSPLFTFCEHRNCVVSWFSAVVASLVNQKRTLAYGWLS